MASSSNTSKGVQAKTRKKKSKKHEYEENLLLEDCVTRKTTGAFELGNSVEIPLGTQKAKVSSPVKAPITKPAEKDPASAHAQPSSEPTPPLRLRLRATTNAGEISDFEVATWKLKTCFRSYALGLISLEATTYPRWSYGIDIASAMAKILKDVLDTTEAADHQQLNILNGELEQELEKCFDFFHSCPAIFDKHARDALFLTTEQMNNLEEELRSTLASKLEVNLHEKEFLITICQGLLANNLTAFKARNAEVQRFEEQLAKTFCDSAFTAYVEGVSRRLSGRICSSEEILLADQQTSKEVFVSLKVTTSELQTRIKQHIQELMDSNARKLEEFHQKTMEAFETCGSVFDRLFARKSEFCSLGDLKREGESALAGALQKFNEVQEQLLPADKIPVRQMMRNYAFETMLKCAPETPNAAQVLANKSCVTVILGNYSSTPLTIHVEGLEPIAFDPHLWLNGDKLMMIDSRIPAKFLTKNDKIFHVTTWVVNSSMRSSSAKTFATSTVHLEQFAVTYFKELDNFLLEALHVIPSAMTVIVFDFANFLYKHRINSAMRLAGLPPPKFMYHSGAVAAGYFDSNSFNSSGSTLFLIAAKGNVTSAQCHFTNTVKISSITRAKSTSFDESGSIRLILKETQRNPDVHSVVLIHDFNDQNWEKIKLKSLLPSHVTHFHPLHVTYAQLTSLAVGGAAFVNKYPSDAVYSESAQHELAYQWNWDEPRKILCRPKHCFEQNVFELAVLEPNSRKSDRCLSVFENNMEVASFKFSPESNTEKLVCSMQLRKDGVLSKPEIRIKSSNQLVEWKMTGPLMPWNDNQFQEIQDPEIAMWKLRDLETAPMKLKNVTLDRPSGSSSSNKRPGEHEDEKGELWKLAEELGKVLSESSAPLAIRKQARLKLDEAHGILGTEDTNLRKVKIGLTAEKLKSCIEGLKGLNID